MKEPGLGWGTYDLGRPNVLASNPNPLWSHRAVQQSHALLTYLCVLLMQLLGLFRGEQLFWTLFAETPDFLVDSAAMFLPLILRVTPVQSEIGPKFSSSVLLKNMLQKFCALFGWSKKSLQNSPPYFACEKAEKFHQ